MSNGDLHDTEFDDSYDDDPAVQELLRLQEEYYNNVKAKSSRDAAPAVTVVRKQPPPKIKSSAPSKTSSKTNENDQLGAVNRGNHVSASSSSSFSTATPLADPLLLVSAIREKQSLSAAPEPQTQHTSAAPRQKKSIFAARRAEQKSKDQPPAVPAQRSVPVSPGAASVQNKSPPQPSAKKSVPVREKRSIVSADATLNRVLQNVVMEKDAGIVEKIPSVDTPNPPGALSLFSSDVPDRTARGGFPEVLHRDERIKRKEQLIAQRRQKEAEERLKQEREGGHKGSNKQKPDVFSMFRTPLATALGGMESEVHEENIGRLAAMTPEEIEEAQREIYEKLDPSLLAMLAKRAAKKYGGVPAFVSEDEASGAGEEKVEGPETNMTDEEREREIENRTVDDEEVREDAAAQPATELEDWIPPDMAELDKLEWTTPADPSSSYTDSPFARSLGLPDKFITSTAKAIASLRFDFSGLPIVKAEDVPTHRGLHHHGDDPTKPGYTIGELLHLSRSTVPSQRVVGLRTLGNIVRRLRTGLSQRSGGTITFLYTMAEDGTPVDAYAIERWVERQNLLLYFRIGLDDTHHTAAGAALAGLAAYADIPRSTADEESGVADTDGGKTETEEAGEGSDDEIKREEHVWDDLFLSRMGHRSLAMGIDTVRRFRYHAYGAKPPPVPSYDEPDPQLTGEGAEEGDETGTLPYVVKLITKDAVRGLLATNILDRFRSLLTRTSNAAGGKSAGGDIMRAGGGWELSPKSVDDVLSILIRIARHSVWACDRILATRGLVEIIRDRFVCTAWPVAPSSSSTPQTSRSQPPNPCAIKLFRILAQSSRSNAHLISLTHGLLDGTSRFLVVPLHILSDPQTKMLGRDLQAETYGLWRCIFTYGLVGRAVDEYRGVLYERLEDGFREIVLGGEKEGEHGTDEDKETDRTKALRTFTHLLRMLVALCRSFGGSLDVGGTNDALRPFVECVVRCLGSWGGRKFDDEKRKVASGTTSTGTDAWSSIIRNELGNEGTVDKNDGSVSHRRSILVGSLEAWSAALDFLAAYASLMDPMRSASISSSYGFVEALFPHLANVHASVPFVIARKTLLSDIQNNSVKERVRLGTSTPPPTHLHALGGLLTTSRTRLAVYLCLETACCDAISSTIDLIRVIATRLQPGRWRGVLGGLVEESGGGNVWDVVKGLVAAAAMDQGKSGRRERREKLETQLLGLGLLGCERGDWIRFFAQGEVTLLHSWLRASGGTRPLILSTALTKDRRRAIATVYATSVAMFSRMLLPGDESIACRILRSCALERGWMRSVLGVDTTVDISSASGAGKDTVSIADLQDQEMWDSLIDMVEVNLYDGTSVVNSEALYAVVAPRPSHTRSINTDDDPVSEDEGVVERQDESSRKPGDEQDGRDAALDPFQIHTLCMEPAGRTGSADTAYGSDGSKRTEGAGPTIMMPVPAGWVFAPLEMLLDEAKVAPPKPRHMDDDEEEEEHEEEAGDGAEGKRKEQRKGGGERDAWTEATAMLVERNLAFIKALEEWCDRKSGSEGEVLDRDFELDGDIVVGGWARKVVALLGLFLLPPLSIQKFQDGKENEEEEEVWRIPRINAMLDRLLDLGNEDRHASIGGNESNHNQWDPTNLELAYSLPVASTATTAITAAGATAASKSQARLYNHYRDVIQQYSSVSFGDPTFARYLLPFLAMRYARDYRALFWEEMLPGLVGSIRVPLEKVPAAAHVEDAKEGLIAWGMKEAARSLPAAKLQGYLLPYERSKPVLAHLVRALVGNQVTLATTPYLFGIAVWHVGRFLFEDVWGSGAAVANDAETQIVKKEKGDVSSSSSSSVASGSMMSVKRTMAETMFGPVSNMSDDVIRALLALEEMDVTNETSSGLTVVVPPGWGVSVGEHGGEGRHVGLMEKRVRYLRDVLGLDVGKVKGFVGKK
ncbi:RNA polymerase II associated protein 1 [Quaeritorhiza haematococci]|nr:RNA polymerase II associated protein 1 [Quaeritorhiza haematococci]